MSPHSSMQGIGIASCILLKNGNKCENTNNNNKVLSFLFMIKTGKSCPVTYVLSCNMSQQGRHYSQALQTAPSSQQTSISELFMKSDGD